MPPPCPICRRVPPAGASARLLPFCSRRCADVDLGRWLTGQYVLPGRDDEQEEAAGSQGAA
jgi:endogenous inhibitor of DNA gyrase (YacG/DUF329 family)